MVHPPSDPALLPGDPDDEGLEAGVGDAPERRVALIDRSLHGVRLDKALVAMAGEFSRNHLQTLIEGGHVWVDDRPATQASRKVSAGQQLVVELVPTPESRA
jgi:23S rRNA pseudouridine1911/1915/1917 synthase